MPYDIFLSYAHGANNIFVPSAYNIYSVLTHAGFHVWFDMVDMTRPTKKEMRTGVLQSKLFLLLDSPDYKKSNNCQYELMVAKKHDKTIILAPILESSRITQLLPYLAPLIMAAP